MRVSETWYLGVDLSADAANTAVAALALEAAPTTSSRPTFKSVEAWTQTQFMRERGLTGASNDDDFVTSLDSFAEEFDIRVIAMDAPFGFPSGWPDDWTNHTSGQHPHFTPARHTLALNPKGGDQATQPDSVFYRATEKCLAFKAEDQEAAEGEPSTARSQIMPLSPVADRLIVPATRACWSLLPKLAARDWSIVRSPQSSIDDETRYVIEVYPSAVRALLTGKKDGGTGKSARTTTIDALVDSCRCDLPEGDDFRSRLHGVLTSGHKVDAFTAALMAHLWRTDPACRCKHESPHEHLVDRSEGWIQVPAPWD